MLTFPHESPPEPGRALEVARGVWWIRMPLPFALDHINLWLLADGDGWTIVDTGYGVEATHTLWQQLFADLLRDQPVKRVIVTHYHPDHVGSASWLCDKTDAPLYMTTGEFLSAHAAADDTAGFDRGNTAALFYANGLAAARPEAEAAQTTRNASFKRGVPKVPTRYRRLMDGDQLCIGERTWRVITTYGHSPEHACLYADVDQLLIAGDQVLPKITTNVGVWGNQPDGNPLQLFLSSIEKLRALSPDTLVLPSHNRVFKGLHERLDELAAHHAERLAALEAALDEPRTAAELLPVLFKRTLDHHQLVFAIAEAIAHLHFLWYAGRARREVGADALIRFVRT